MDPRKGIKRVNRPVCLSKGSLLKKETEKFQMQKLFYTSEQPKNI